MSRDSSHTHLHFHASHHADLFEEFCHPPSSNVQSSSSQTSQSQGGPSGATSGPNDPGMTHVPGHFLPFEEIVLLPHLMPANPEDEDDVVPDMHAAFGIRRAMDGSSAPGISGEGSGRGVTQEPAWRDLGMELLLDRGGGAKVNGEGVGGGVSAARREGKRSKLVLMR